ncbi:hypothetical protein BGZ93_008834 [Podila epicladia]|nr:hypothetical protein BGZ93_008834 [Podila epicladia]
MSMFNQQQQQLQQQQQQQQHQNPQQQVLDGTFTTCFLLSHQATPHIFNSGSNSNSSITKLIFSCKTSKYANGSDSTTNNQVFILNPIDLIPSRKSLAPPQLVSTPVATTASSMDVMTMFPPLAPHHSFSPNSTLLLQDPIQLASLSIHDQKEVQLKQQQHLEQQQLQLKQQQEHTLLHQHHLQRQQVQQQHPLNVAPYYNPLKYEGMCEGGHSSHSAPKGLYNPDGVSRNLRIPSGSARTFVSA